MIGKTVTKRNVLSRLQSSRFVLKVSWIWCVQK